MLAYGMSKFKLADTMQISVDRASEIIENFFKIVPEVKKFLDMLGKLGTSRGYIRTAAPFKRMRIFPQWEESMSNSSKSFLLKGEIERASMNMPIQGTNGDIIKVALINTYNIIKDEKWPVKILLSVYDELQTECEEHAAEAWKHRLDIIMLEAAQTVIKNVPIVVDCSVSNYWSK